MKLEHIGIAVADAAAVMAQYEALFGAKPYKEEVVEREGVRTIFYDAGGTKIELLHSTTPDGPVAKFIAKRGPGLHHLAFAVADVDAEIARLKTLGYTLLSDTAKPGADGKRIVFLHPKDTHGVLIELCADAQ
jgi:methylmalonyl-CoA/ethylmalonyl-CoA epimerase